MIGIGVILLTQLPYLFAWTSAGPVYQFGGFLLNPLDGFSYLAKMYTGYRGDWLFTLPYTAAQSGGAFLFMFYIFLGHLARWLHLPLLLTFHLARLVATLCLLWALRSLVNATLPAGSPRRMATFLLAFGSGMGWLAVLSGSLTSDFWVAEAYPFLAAFANPHFPLSLALLIFLLLPSRKEARTPVVLAVKIMAAFLLANLSPFGALIAGVVSALMAAVTSLRVAPQGELAPAWERFAAPLSILVGGAPVVLYQFLAIRTDPLLAGWNAQNQTPAPAWWDLVLSFSPALIFAGLAMLAALRRKAHLDPLALVWSLTCLAFVVFPYALQRRFLLGLYVPLALLAVGWVSAYGQPAIDAPRAGGGKRRLGILLVVLSLPTNWLLLASAFSGVATRNPLVYLTRTEAQALAWVEANTAPDTVFIASPESGLFIPAMTGRRVLYGHPFETVNAQAEKARIEAFYQSLGQESRPVNPGSLVDYVLWGPRERRLAKAPQLGPLLDTQTSGWQLVYQADDVFIYSVK